MLCQRAHSVWTELSNLSEHVAYGRIEAARAAGSFPIILERLADGTLTLTAASLLRPHLTAENHCEVLDAARLKTKRQIEELVARLRPQPAIPASIRKLPRAEPFSETAAVPMQRAHTATTVAAVAESLPERAGPIAASAKPAIVRPLAPERYKVQFTVSGETHAKLRQVQDLVRNTIPNGIRGDFRPRR